jgi:uncharacterized protein YjbI with pentapeptide repeats
MVQHNPNSPPSPLGKAKAELKSLLQQAAIVFGCFVVMVLVTGGRPPGWMIPLTFLLSGGIVFWLEHKRDMADSRSQAVDLRQLEESATSSVVQFPDRLTPPPDAELSESTASSQSTQEVPIHLLQEGRVKKWNEWRQKNFSVRLELRGANLYRANLGFEDRKNTGLSYDALTGFILAGADLRYADFTEANLEGVNLTNAILTRIDLYRANLIGANLTNTIFRFANLTDANLTEANLTYSNLIDANLSSANLSSANLSNANLSNANLSNANLEGADLTKANLIIANLTNVNLSFANLSGANLGGAILIDAILTNAIVENAKFGEGLGLSESEKFDLKRPSSMNPLTIGSLLSDANP